MSVCIKSKNNVIVSGKLMISQLSHVKIFFWKMYDYLDNNTIKEQKCKTNLEVSVISYSFILSYCIKPFQIDENVLQELPPDIQEEIRKHMKSKGSHPQPTQAPSTSTKPQDGADDVDIHTSQEAGCSHWTPPPVGQQRISPLPDEMRATDQVCGDD